MVDKLSWLADVCWRHECALVGQCDFVSVGGCKHRQWGCRVDMRRRGWETWECQQDEVMGRGAAGMDGHDADKSDG